MIVGMDFGTTNSGMAVYDGKELHRLPLDHGSDNPRILRSALYITNEQDVFIGRTAIDRYFEHNVGRPVKLEKVWVGEFEIRGADMYFVTDAYVWADVMSPGRLFLSFKTNLRDNEYTGTMIGSYFYPIESLVALFLYVSKRRAEALLGRELKEVVLGRPVHFADDPQHDALAQERLLRGAFQAGYEKVYLQREPVAAAYHYASLQDEPQNILVFDFGGGTLDITIMRLGDGAREVLATGGVPIAGDIFDQKLVRAKLPQHFGEGSKYGPKEMPIPRWIYDNFSNWQTILELQTPENRRVLRQIEQTAQRPREIRALISLVSSNYGLQMFDVVERTKRSLSERFGGMIRLEGPGFDVLELVTRREFENIIRPEYIRIEKHLDEAIRASGLAPEELDGVIRTGGSAQIPLFQQLLRRKFGADKVHSVDTFGSVTAGLGIIAHGVEQGEIVTRAYTRADLQQQEVQVTRPGATIVDLELLKRRIVARTEAGENAEDGESEVLLLLTRSNRLLAARLEEERVPALAEPPLTALKARLDEQLLLITSRYRFLLTTPRQLRDLAALGQTLAQLHHFAAREKVFAAARWESIKAASRMVLATSTGYVRAYPTGVMTTSVEAPVPLTFEQPLPGWPLAALGAHPEQQLLLFTANGRGIRWPVAELPTSGMQLLNRDEEDEIVGVHVAGKETRLLLATGQGYARRLYPEMVHRPEKANAPGRVLISRRPVSGTACTSSGETVWALTTAGMKEVDPERIPAEHDSTKSYRLLQPGKGENLLGLVTTTVGQAL